jgi:hypothetical protein
MLPNLKSHLSVLLPTISTATVIILLIKDAELWTYFLLLASNTLYFTTKIFYAKYHGLSSKGSAPSSSSNRSARRRRRDEWIER